MATQEEITKLQEQSQELVNSLSELYKFVGSYQRAKEELQKVSSQVLELVESTKLLSEESHEIIKVTNQIGSSKIFEQLDTIIETIKQVSKKNTIIMTIGFCFVIIMQIIFYFLGKS